MAGPFTQPDPLYSSNRVKTFSIYVTELQVCVNDRRDEISQVALTFINQSIGKTMRLNAIEELKTLTAQLAFDFGYALGIEDPTLLGRPYVDHPKVNGRPATGFPIINDLRRVLELLEVQVDVGFPNIIWANDSWFEYTLPASPTIDRQDTAILASFGSLNNGNPLTSAPDFSQGLFSQKPGTVCPEGFPTCDNTNFGSLQPPRKFQYTTDRFIGLSVIFGGISRTLEGPLGGDYTNTPFSEVTEFLDGGSNPFGFTVSFVDGEDRWTIKDNAIWKRPADGFTDWVRFSDNTLGITNSISGAISYVGRTHLFMNLGTQGQLIAMNKSNGDFHLIGGTGSGSLNIIEDNITPIGTGPPDINGDPVVATFGPIKSQLSKWIYRAGFIETFYAESRRSQVENDGPTEFVNTDLTDYGASCIIRIPEGQNTFDESDCIFKEIITSTKFEIDPAPPGTTLVGPRIFTRFAEFFDDDAGSESPFAPDIFWLNGHITSNLLSSFGMPSATNSGRWHLKYSPSKSEFAITGAGAPGIFRTFNDVSIGTIDYKGDAILEEHVTTISELPNDWTPEKNGTASAYVDSSGATPTIIENTVTFTVDNRRNSTVDDEKDIADLKVISHFTGAFRYRIERRVVGTGLFLGTSGGAFQSFKNPLEVLDFGDGFNGLDAGFDYEIILNIATSQGDFEGTNIVTILAISPRELNPPLIVQTVNPEEVNISWVAPVGGVAPTGYEIEYQAPFPGPITGPVNVGLVTSFIVNDPSLTPGAQIRARVRGLKGTDKGAWSSHTIFTIV